MLNLSSSCFFPQQWVPYLFCVKNTKLSLFPGPFSPAASGHHCLLRPLLLLGLPLFRFCTSLSCSAPQVLFESFPRILFSPNKPAFLSTLRRPLARGIHSGQSPLFFPRFLIPRSDWAPWRSWRICFFRFVLLSSLPAVLLF